LWIIKPPYLPRFHSERSEESYAHKVKDFSPTAQNDGRQRKSVLLSKAKNLQMTRIADSSPAAQNDSRQRKSVLLSEAKNPMRIKQKILRLRLRMTALWHFSIQRGGIFQ
jgi:hypothetical protein